jgi:hypothetical protein
MIEPNKKNDNPQVFQSKLHKKTHHLQKKTKLDGLEILDRLELFGGRSKTGDPLWVARFGIIGILIESQ